MADLLMIVPSRGRPEHAKALALNFKATCTAGTHLYFAVDDDDPTREQYPGDLVGPRSGIDSDVSQGPEHSMVRALNASAMRRVNGDDPPFAVGFMGDDHRPRTVGWDQRYLDALREMGCGIVYGNDLLQRENIPTQCAMTSNIVRALGYMAPPTFKHLYVDVFWKVLANGADCLRYLPDVVVEHMHPVAGKAAWDVNYNRVNSQAVYAHDEAMFHTWMSHQMREDVAKVRNLGAVVST
jgi:hypothetical protein